MKKRIISALLAALMLLTLLPVATFGEQQIEDSQMPDQSPVEFVSYLRTKIEADKVVNYDGYASISLNGLGRKVDHNEITVTYTVRQPQYALANQYGEFVFPYTNDLGYDYFYDEPQYYFVKDGLVSVQGGYSYNGIFYNLDGTKAFELEKTLTDYHFDYESMDGYVVNRREPYFVMLIPFSDGVAIVRERLCADWSIPGVLGGVLEYASSYLIDKSGNILYTFPEDANEITSMGAGGITFAWAFSNASEGKIPCMYCGYDVDRRWVNDLLGYLDYEGNKVIDLSGYHVGQAFSEGLAAVSKRTYSTDEYGYSTYQDNYGYIDADGNEVIACQFSEAREFSDGYAAVKKDNKWGYINKNGETVIPFEYDNAYGAGSGLFSVIKNGKCGIVNIENDVIVPLEYNDISSCEGGIAYAVKDGKLVVITPSDVPDDPAPSGGCYVATCVYGSYDCPEVWTLRRFRDETLAKTWYGRAFIHTYYAISPTIVKWFGDTDWFKDMWRGPLDKMVSNLNAKGVPNTAYDDIDW